MNYVYVIYNCKHNKFYIGETNDLKERLQAHNDH
jgi:predicted GIY-YIG superfamily endonuclease